MEQTTTAATTTAATQKVNPFAAAKKKETASAKDDTPVFQIAGLGDDIRKLQEAKQMIAQYEAQLKMAEGVIKEKGREKFLEIVQRDSKRLTSFKIMDELEVVGESGKIEKKPYTVLFGLQDRYSAIKDVSTAKKINEAFPDTVETITTYSFNKEILEKYFDQIGEALMNADMPDDAKTNLFENVETYVVKKGTIDTLPVHKERAPMLFQAIQPTAFLK